MANATATPGTIPALTIYQPGALPITGSEALEIVNTTTATAAASYSMLITDLVGKSPSVMTTANPTANDMVAFFQIASGLPRATQIGNFSLPAGNLPVGGATGQILGKVSGSNYDTSWDSITQFVAVGTALATSGTATSIVVSIPAGGIGSTQLGAFAVQAGNVATNVVGNVQLRQGAPLSVIGIAGNATANVADIISAATSGFVLQVNSGATGLVFGAAPASKSPPFNATTLAANGVLYGNGTSTVSITAAGNTSLPLLGQGAANAPLFGVLPVIGGGTNTTTLTAFGVIYGNGTSTVGITAAGGTALPLTGNGNAAPSFAVLTVPGGGLGTAALASHGLVVAEGTSALTVVVATTAGALLSSQGTASDPVWTTVVGPLTITRPSFSGAITLSARIVTAQTVTVNATTDYLIACNTATSFTVNLPINPATVGLTFLVKDYGGNASGANSITIAAQTGNIDAATTYVITSSYGAAGVTYMAGANGTTQWSLT